MAAHDTIGLLARELALALRPLAGALASANALRDFLEQLGWAFEAAPAPLQSLRTPIAAVVALPLTRL